MLEIKGFTLLEIAITLVIVAIMSLFSFITYEIPWLKNQHACAQLALMSLASEMEQYHALNQSYQDVTLEQMKFLSAKGYKLTIQSADRDHFLLAAIPIT